MAFWDRLVAFDHSIWVLCAVLYVLDHLKLLAPSQLLCGEKLGGGWKFRLHTYPFTIGGKDLYVLNPLFPWLATFVLSWGCDRAPTGNVIRKTHRDVMVFQCQVGWLRLVSGLSFLSLFVMGPILTATRGLAQAITVVAFLHLGLIALASIALWCIRGTLALSTGKLLALVGEAVVCAPYAASLLKRVSVQYRMEGDGVGLAKALKQRGNFQELVTYAVMRLEQPGAVGECEEDAGTPSIHDYVAQLRAWL